jgi:hypothetical protein
MDQRNRDARELQRQIGAVLIRNWDPPGHTCVTWRGRAPVLDSADSWCMVPLISRIDS